MSAQVAAPGWSERLYWRTQPYITPGLENSQYAYARLLRRELGRARSWLDLGCGHEALPGWLVESERRLDLTGRRALGVDIDEAALRRHAGVSWRVRANVEQLPFGQSRFDLVTANTVLEHVDRPDALFHEVHRVLTPGGLFLVHTPNLNGYTTILAALLPRRVRPSLAGWLHGRGAADVYPTRYRANTPSALRRLAHEAGLATLDVSYVNSSPQMVRIPPLMLLELLVIRSASRSAFAWLRACLLAVFRKPAAASSAVR